MADFDFATLITDRSRADLDALRDMLSTPMSDWTAEQFAAFNLAASKGAYNFTDLNRVTEAMEALDGMLSGMGYKTGYAPVVVHPAEPAPPSQYTYRYFRMQINAVRSGGEMQWYTANDEPNRDPVSFVFQGSRDGADWVTLDEAEGATITEARETLAYTGDLKNEANITPTIQNPAADTYGTKEITTFEPEVDSYVWYEEDVPTQTQMRLYLNNVAAIYKTLLSEPALPESMANLTAAGANQIEEALSTINNYIARIALSFWRCGEILCGEG